MNRLRTNGEAEISLHKQKDKVPREGINGRCGNLRLDGTSARSSCDENCKEKHIAGSSSSQSDVICKKARRQKEMTFQDMYESQNLLDDEDEDDSDWEPLQKHVEVMKWFCTNCTMLNFDDIDHCDVCGEHKESGILRHGCFASPLLQDANLTDSELETKEWHKDGLSQNTAPSSSTAIGFDERMLLHSERVQMLSKSLLMFV